MKIHPLKNDDCVPEHKLSPWQHGNIKPKKDGLYQREFTDGVYLSEYCQGSWRYDGFFDSDEQTLPWRGLKAKKDKS